MTNKAKTHCKYGHEYTPENTYTHSGKRTCITCREQLRVNGPRPVISAEEAFWARVNKTLGLGRDGDCWEWTGSGVRDYGRLMVGGKTYGAHRYSFKIANGFLPDEKCVLHSCDNPSCVNPLHLSLGTQKENALDKISKGRHQCQKKTHCKKGHPFTIENTSFAKGNGQRICKQCKREANTAKRRAANYSPPVDGCAAN